MATRPERARSTPMAEDQLRWCRDWLNIEINALLAKPVAAPHRQQGLLGAGHPWQSRPRRYAAIDDVTGARDE